MSNSSISGIPKKNKVLSVDEKIGDVKTIEIIESSVDVNPALPYKNYLIDASSAVRTVKLPDVTTGDEKWYRISLVKDGNHCKVTTVGGTQLICNGVVDCTELELATVQTDILLKANGVDGYNIITDTRLYLRNISVIDDLDLTGGYEANSIYVGTLEDGQSVTITIDEPSLLNKGFEAKFVKLSGDNSAMRVKTSDGIAFDETITSNLKGFTIAVVEDIDGLPQYAITQDSRPSENNVSINFLPTANVSVIEPTYKVLETDSQTETTFTSSAITSTDNLNPDSLGFWINDSKALTGTLAERNITATGFIKLTSAFNRTVRIKFKYYEYDYDTNTLNTTPLFETSYSRAITNTATFEEYLISGLLPENAWTDDNKTLVVELLAYKNLAAGDDPTIDFRSGGTNPSKTTVDVPVASISHNILAGRNLADQHPASAITPSAIETATLTVAGWSGGLTQTLTGLTVVAGGTVLVTPQLTATDTTSKAMAITSGLDFITDITTDGELDAIVTTTPTADIVVKVKKVV